MKIVSSRGADEPTHGPVQPSATLSPVRAPSAPAERSAMSLATALPATRSEEAAYVRRAIEGDPQALQWVARTQEARVRRLLVRILGPRQDLDDLVQNVFLELCRALPRFRHDSRLSTFVGGITVRVARRAMSPTAWFRRRGEMPEEPVALESAPDAQSLAAERVRRTRRALSKLSDKKRIAFLLWALEGVDVAEIAEMMDASVSATRSRIFYAQKELKRLAQTDPYLRELMEEP